MRESAFWRSIRKGLVDASDNTIFLQRHEDNCSPGIPDISFCYQGVSGWIELKYRDKFPIKESTPILFSHFTIIQRKWMEQYTKAGGNGWILLRIEKETFLIKGQAAKIIGELNHRNLINIASAYWCNRVDYKMLLYLLKGNTPRIRYP